MSTANTGAGVSMGDIYGLLLEDIRKNRAQREAAQRDRADDHAAQLQADETQRQGGNNGKA